MSIEGEPSATAGISRRTVLKRGAAGAGAFWAVPVIDSFMSPAAASTGSTTCLPSVANISYYFFNMTCGNKSYRVKVEQSGTVSYPTSPDKCGAPDPPGGFTAGPPPQGQVTVSTANGVSTITLPAGCSIVGGLIYGHAGSFGNDPPCTPPSYENDKGKCHCRVFTSSC